MGFQEMTIAKSEHAALNEKMSHLPNKGGTIVTVPNIIDRALAALRKAMAPAK